MEAGDGKAVKPVGIPVADPVRGRGGLTEGDGDEGGRRRGAQSTF